MNNGAVAIFVNLLNVDSESLQLARTSSNTSQPQRSLNNPLVSTHIETFVTLLCSPFVPTTTIMLAYNIIGGYPKVQISTFLT